MIASSKPEGQQKPPRLAQPSKLTRDSESFASLSIFLAVFNVDGFIEEEIVDRYGETLAFDMTRKFFGKPFDEFMFEDDRNWEMEAFIKH